jgi:hypothetical protein
MTATIVVHTASHKSAVDCLPLSGRAADRSWSHRIQQIAAATPNAVGGGQSNVPSSTAFTSSVLSNVTSVGRFPVRHGEDAQATQQNRHEGQNQRDMVPYQTH